MSLRAHFIKLFSKECVDNILDSETLKLKNSDVLKQFLENYSRIIRLNQNEFRIKGCTDCLDKGIAIRQQDFPGWIGELKEKDLIILGLEVSPKVKQDIHIAYNLGNERRKIDMRLYEMFGLIYNNLENRAYITDIAKCFSSDVNVSRMTCLNYFKKELALVRELNPKSKIIIQGYQTQEKISKHFRNIYIDETFELDPLIRKGELIFENNRYPILVFPHTSRSKGAVEKWKEIKQEISRIKEVLGE